MADQPPSAAAGDQLSGSVERIIYYSDDSHWCVAELMAADGKACHTITGKLPGVQCGETLELTGQWNDHPQYGRQFQASSYRSMLPNSVYGLRKYLGSGLVPGIGSGFADKIVDKFGLDTLAVIESDSGRLREVPGIGPKRARQIKAAWDEQRTVREVMVFLQTYGVTPRNCLRIVNRFGFMTIAALNQDPYQVAREIDGIGFKTADRIARNLGFANESPRRIDAGIIHFLKEREADGHTGWPAATTPEAVAQLLEVDPSLVLPRITELAAAGDIVGSGDPALWQLPATHRAELRMAESLQRIASAPSNLPHINIPKAVEWAQQQAHFTFAPAQAAALGAALANRCAILTGGPGTGKTTILRALTQILKAKQCRILLASPTGRAAQRLAEATHLNAQTIHRLLRFDPASGSFTVNERQPLNADFLIVDEASMLDTWLASALLRAVPSGCHLLLVGDVHQLPSVGAGNVLGDLIGCGLFHVSRLDRIYRQAEHSSIVAIAHNILNGETTAPYVIDDPARVDKRGDFFFVRAPSADVCQSMLVALCRQHIPQLFPKFDPMRDVQVLAPMHRGTAGIGNFNTLLQRAFKRYGKVSSCRRPTVSGRG
jgi:exodeoxyribonuclease V alpha subunit